MRKGPKRTATYDERVGLGADVQVLQAVARERKVHPGRQPRPGDHRRRLRDAAAHGVKGERTTKQDGKHAEGERPEKAREKGA